MERQDLAGLSKQERKIIRHFTALEKRFIGADDVMQIHPCTRGVANQMLSRLYKKGWLQRLKRGLYSIVPISSSTNSPVIEDSWLLATELFEPAFISGWSAAEYWDLTEQIFNSISVVTTKPQKSVTQLVGNVSFRVRTIEDERFFGAKTIWLGSKSVEVADINRVVVDILDVPRFGGGARHVVDVLDQYWLSQYKNVDTLLDYVIRYNRGSVVKRLGFLAEVQNAPVSAEWFARCEEHVTKGITLFDPDGPSSGKIISRWNLQINLPI